MKYLSTSLVYQTCREIGKQGTEEGLLVHTNHTSCSCENVAVRTRCLIYSENINLKERERTLLK